MKQKTLVELTLPSYRATDNFSKFFIDSKHRPIPIDIRTILERLKDRDKLSIEITNHSLDSKLRPLLKNKHCIILSSSNARKNVSGLDGLEKGEFYSGMLDTIKLASRLEGIAGSEDHVLIAFGGGNVIDIAKYLASMNNLQLIAVPTIMSTNVFSTNKTTFKTGKDGIIISETVNTKTPDHVIIDSTFIASAPKRLNISGAGDVLCLVTAVEDWRLARAHNNEKIDASVYDYVLTIIDLLYEHRDVIKRMDKHGIILLSELLLATGDIVNNYGSGRPVSGSEHMLEVAIRKRIPEERLLHGEVVALGVLNNTALQDKSPAVISKFMDELGLPRSLSIIGVNPELTEAAVSDSKDIRKDRFTVLNVKHPDAEMSKKMMRGLLAEGILKL